MSTKVVRSVKDFSRFRMDIDLECACGHRETLDWRPVVSLLVRRNWPADLGSASRRFRCSCCGGHPVHIGPRHR